MSNKIKRFPTTVTAGSVFEELENLPDGTYLISVKSGKKEINKLPDVMADNIQIGRFYNWKNQPERLVYLGKKGLWHQFAQVGKIGIWCEVLDNDLHMIEETVQ